MELLDGIQIVSLAVNLPGPAAVRRLSQLGAQVLKVEPPSGDPMAQYNAEFYKDLNSGQDLLALNLKSPSDLQILYKKLEKADLLITATRPAALERLGLGWEELRGKFPRLCQVAIVGYPPPLENEPGHDLTYQAKIGLLSPPQMPRTLLADMAGAEKAVSESLALLLARERGQGCGYRMVALSEAAEYMGEPWTVGLTVSTAILGGILPEYNLYQASDGWVAVAALEPHFKTALSAALDCEPKNPDDFRPLFRAKTVNEWETWARELGLPVVAVTSK